jgi:hypothetical protein
MIDARSVIDEVCLRFEDEAYWQALEKIFGTITARTVRGTFRVKRPDEGLRERDRVARGLTEVFASQARTVENLARKEATVKGPRGREEAMQDLGVHEHWVDFAEPEEQAGRIVSFIERGLAHGAKVVGLVSSETVPDFRQQVADTGHAADLNEGRLAIFAADNHVNLVNAAGVLTVFLLAMQGFLHGARGQGYHEVWFVSTIVSTLLPTVPTADLLLRLETGLDAFIRAFPTTVYCPFPERFPGDPGIVSELLKGHTWASVNDLALPLSPSRG